MFRVKVSVTGSQLQTHWNTPGVLCPKYMSGVKIYGLVHISGESEELPEQSWSVSSKYKSGVKISGLVQISGHAGALLECYMQVQVWSILLWTCAHLQDAGALLESFMQVQVQSKVLRACAHLQDAGAPLDCAHLRDAGTLLECFTQVQVRSKILRTCALLECFMQSTSPD
jgi:hypothetical protein